MIINNNFWKIIFTLLICFLCIEINCFSQVRGDSVAIRHLELMVEQMGGVDIWKELRRIQFEHRWYFWNKDSYHEKEILDLTESKSWVEMKNETFHRIRAYSPQYRYWNLINGEFEYASGESFDLAMERAPYSIYRIARGIAQGDSFYRIEFGQEEFRGTRRIDIFGPDDRVHGFLVLNHKYEPLVWGTTQYKYTFGPMIAYGNLRVPKWGSTGDGAVTYEMISLFADNIPPEDSLFKSPIED